MGEVTAISWCDHTFNLVWGCQRVSPACENCYAEAFSHRLGKDLWGPKAERQVMSESYWQQPLKWNRYAEKTGTRKRVFCSSMADVFEDHKTVNFERHKLFLLIEDTPHLDWLLLTKRPENINRMLPRAWREKPRPNVWLGVTVENQKYADERIPLLLQTPAAVRFLSCEPLLGALGLAKYLYTRFDTNDGRFPYYKIDWVIVGGESGSHARPMHPDWARSLRDQCAAADVAFHFKQWGEYVQAWQVPLEQAGTVAGHPATVLHGNGEQSVVYRVGKHAAGRLLDGREWNEFPKIAE
jgi:protein gp37